MALGTYEVTEGRKKMDPDVVSVFMNGGETMGNIAYMLGYGE